MVSVRLYHTAVGSKGSVCFLSSYYAISLAMVTPRGYLLDLFPHHSISLRRNSLPAALCLFHLWYSEERCVLSC